uniref:Arylamine N-acetyltransferase n=1 Tax=Roseihalotalea indica TaxID=2867963 RepID=A0AA49JEK5_9BACT|nr:arylamine N-acetyltransferase [Tunicatimonas sp. TK19036]
MNTEAYLDRIGYTGSLEPTLSTLKALQRAHLLQVPFENLDIHRNEEIRIDTARFYDKIITRRRGGFCFEVNGLFNELLTALGFSTHFISCSVFSHPHNQYAPYFGHVAIIAHLEDDWLVDVGFGTNFPEPLRLNTPAPQRQDGTYYRLTALNEEETLLERSADHQEYIKMYKFRPQPHALADFAQMCAYHQTSSQSPFTQGRLCSLMTPTGRITLTDKAFIETIQAEKTEYPIADQAGFAKKLYDRFGIAL